MGCPKNQIDLEVMLHRLIEAGYEITEEDAEADIILINTCAFIQSAKQESIDNILDAAWLKKRQLRGIIVTGCLSERYRDEVLREMPEVDAVLGCGCADQIVDAVRAVEAACPEKTPPPGGWGEAETADDPLPEETDSAKRSQPLGCYAAFAPPEHAAMGGDRAVTTPFYYAYMKIAEGCDNCCSYCIIPKLRGHFRSRPMEELVAEAQTLESLGVRELILVAQDTSRYGKDLYGEYRLADLIQAITDATKIPWIRLLYCYPDKITEELIAQLRDNPRLCKYIDIPIQHISDHVLHRMNRHGGSALIRDTLSRLRREVPGITIRTTAIVGFPGETKEDFSELCEFVRSARFDRFGAFPYSQEEDTPAAEMDGQIDEEVKQQRYDRIMKLQMGISRKLLKQKLGRKIRVLCEGFDYVAGMQFGRSEADAPEIDGKVYFRAPAEKIAEGSFVDVRITEVLDYDLIGEVAP